MLQTSPGSSPGWKRLAADAPEGPGGESSCLTIRLPDISSPRDSAKDLSHARRDPPHSPGPTAEAQAAGPSPTPLTGRAALAAEQWRRTADILLKKADILRTRVVPFVRQPKFWLACVTAIGVQVLLAAIMTPAEEGPSEHVRTAANPWRKPAPVPPERIVVPPAQGSHDAGDAVDSEKHGTTTPLGATAPLDAPKGTGPVEPASTETDDVVGASPFPRMAENRRLAGDGRKFDGVPSGDADGATLGGIVPLEPMPETNLHEPRR
ncbi:MAG TPA: hypothetical protein VG826_04295 [Pirellulales bacterium]|nr:hypothetical protein [Pirellulales bacterium]